MFLILAATVLLLFFYYLVWIPSNYWKKFGIPYIQPYPVVGNFAAFIFKYTPIPVCLDQLYHTQPNEKILGVHCFLTPALFVRDPELIKTLTIQNFDHFMDHTDIVFKEDIDPIAGKNLFSLKGDRWRKMRATLSPAFTGNKLRKMVPFICECSQQMVDYFKTECPKVENQILDIELKDVWTRLTNDVVASTAFGFQCNSFADRDNVFYRMGREISKFNMVKFFFIQFFPSVAKFLGMHLISQTVIDYFGSVIHDNIRKRKEDNIVRPDMLHLLIEAQKGQLTQENEDFKHEGFAVEANNEIHNEKSNIIQLSDDDITAQAFVFFFAGFETVSTVLSFALYEVAISPDVNEKLKTEIDKLFIDGKEITYDDINQIKYLDMVLSETLRKWTPTIWTDRVVTKPFLLEVDQYKIQLQPKMVIQIPQMQIQCDSKYFPNPKKFDPERFNEENKPKIIPGTYLPFGIGPRNCIGNRFALLEMKIALVYMLRNFEVMVTKKTEIPLKLSVLAGNLSPKNGYWVGIRPRNL